MEVQPQNNFEQISGLKKGDPIFVNIDGVGEVPALFMGLGELGSEVSVSYAKNGIPTASTVFIEKVHIITPELIVGKFPPGMTVSVPFDGGSRSDIVITSSWWDQVNQKMVLEWDENGVSNARYFSLFDIQPGINQPEKLVENEAGPVLRKEEYVFVTFGTEVVCAQIVDLAPGKPVKISWLKGDRLEQKLVPTSALVQASSELLASKFKKGDVVSVPDSTGGRKEITILERGLVGEDKYILMWKEDGTETVQSGRFIFNDIQVVPAQAEQIISAPVVEDLVPTSLNMNEEENWVPAIGDEVTTRDKKGKLVEAELVSINGKKVVVGYYDDRKQWIELPKKLSEVNPNKKVPPHPVSVVVGPVSVTTSVQVESESQNKPILVTEQTPSLVSTESIEPVTMMPEVATVESVSDTSEVLRVEDVKKILEEALEKTGYDEACKNEIRQWVKRGLDKNKNNLQRQYEVLMKNVHILNQDWEHENEQSLLLPEELHVGMVPLNTFLGNPTNRQKISDTQYQKLVQLQQQLVSAYSRLQAVDEPNPSESDPKTRKNILRKYSNIAKSALEEAVAIINISNSASAVMPSVVMEPQLSELPIADSVSISEIEPEVTTPEPVVGIERVDEVMNVELTFELSHIDAVRAKADALLQHAELSPMEREDVEAVISRLIQLEALFKLYGHHPAAIAATKREGIKKPLAAIQLKLNAIIEKEAVTHEGAPEVEGPMQLTGAMRVPVKTVPEADPTTPLSTQSTIPPGPKVNLFRTEEVVLPDIPSPVNRPGVAEDAQQKETLLPLDEKLYELRQTKNAYVQALSRAIQMKTLARQGEQAAFAEGALRAVEAASDVYYRSLSKVQLQMMQNVSSKFAISKDSEVVKSERDFYDENTVAHTIKNVAGILRKKLFGNVTLGVNQKMQMPESNAAPLPGVTRAFSILATEVPADPHMSFNEPVPAAELVVSEPETFEQYDGVEDITDADRVKFPPFGKAKDIDITDAVSDDVVRIEPGAIDTSSTVLEADVVELTTETQPASEMSLGKIYAYLHNFPDGLDALSDRVKSWIFQTEGVHGSRPNVPGRLFFTSAQLATPYEALKQKTVREILTLHKSKSGVAHALDELHLTPAGFALWANRLAKFELNYPGIDIQAEPLREAVKILFAVEQLESPVNLHNI